MQEIATALKGLAMTCFSLHGAQPWEIATSPHKGAPRDDSQVGRLALKPPINTAYAIAAACGQAALLYIRKTMNVTQQGIITLLKSAVTGEVFPLPGGFDLAAAWPQVKKHHMASLLYEGAVLCGIPRDSDVMQTLFHSCCRSLLVSEGQMAEVRRLFDAFDKNGVDYLPLKGCVMKGRYPKPELRTMGDADVLIRLEQREKFDAVLEELGFVFREETDHELVWNSRKLCLELHKHLIPSYNRDLHPYFGAGWQLARHRSHGLHVMEPEDEFLFLFTHFAKHYRDGGVGCRYVVDLWVFLRCFPDLDTQRVERELENLGLLAFYRNTRDLMDHWFAGGPGSEKLTIMTDYIFSSGSWGQMESRALSRAVRDGGHGPLGGRLLYLWQTAFPPVEVLRGKYTVLKKCPWLLPVVWLVRPVYKVLFEFGTLTKQERNLSALSRDNIDSRRRMLQYVGLDYRF